MGDEDRPVERPAGQHGVAREHRHHEHGGDDARILVRKQLPPQPGAPRQEPAGMLREHLEVAGERPHLPALLLRGIGGLGIVGRGRGIEAHTPAVVHGDLHRDDHVVEQGVIRDGLEEFPPDGVDRAGRADGGAEPAFAGPDEFLEPPIEVHTAAHAGRRRVNLQRAAHRAERGVGKVRDQLGDRVRRETLPRIAEHDDLAACGGDGGIEAGGLAGALLAGEDAHTRVGKRTELRHSAVGRAVGDDEDFELVGGIAGRQQVRDAGDNALLLVERDEHDGDGGRVRRRRLHGRAVGDFRQQADQSGIAEEGVGQRGEAEPEEELASVSTRHEGKWSGRTQMFLMTQSRM